MQSIILLTNEMNQIDEFIKKNFSTKDVIIFFYPEKNEYSIDQIRGLQKEVKYFNPKRRIYVFYDFHHSSLESQNAFLKLLEEPPANVYFVLCCQNLYQILPTIVSRTKIIDLKNKKVKVEDERIKEIIEKIKNGQLVFIDILDRQEAKKIIFSAIYYFKDELKTNTKVYQILKEAIQNLFLLENNYLNPQTTLDNFFIFLYKCYNE